MMKIVGNAKLDSRIVEWAREHGIPNVYSYEIRREVGYPGRLTLTFEFDTDLLESDNKE